MHSEIVLENETLRLRLSPTGVLEEFIDMKTGANYVAGGASAVLFKAARAGRDVPVSLVLHKDDRLEIQFGRPDITVVARVAAYRHYFTMSIEEVSGDEVDWIQMCRLCVRLTDNVGSIVNAAWNREFAACMLACNDLVHAHGGGGDVATLSAECYREYGMENAKIAIIGAPQPQLLDVIEEVEMEQGLPHPTINGVWIKRAPERFSSYLMAHSISEDNVDKVLEFAQGGFGCVEFYPWHSTPTYGLNAELFPNGLAGLKKVADKIHAAGLQVGLHVMQGMVGWGAKDDPYITPKADARLLQDRHATLTDAAAAETTELAVKEHVSEWPEQGDLFIEGEIVRYTRRTLNGFAGCQRGLHGTHVIPHAAGTRLGHLVNCFSFMGNVVYAPGVDSTMIDEICDTIARVFNEVGCDMSYFDAGEEVAVQPPHWRNQGRIALGVMRRLKKPVILEGNALYTNLSWHVSTRGSPSYDPIYFGRREYTLRFKGQNPATWAKNLLTGDVGWFAAHVHSPSTDAVTPDEVMLLCLKAVGGKAPISIQVRAGFFWQNRRMLEMLEIIRACDELKRRDYFSESACAELSKPMAEHVLEQAADGQWAVRPLQFGPARVVNARHAGLNEWRYSNPHAAQSPWIRIRARTCLAPYGSRDNMVLADFVNTVPFNPGGTASPELVQSMEPSAEKTPDGASTFCYRARNKSKETSSWCRLSLSFSPVMNLCDHRRLGVWVRSEGQGGILNVQLANTYGYRDHYIPLDFKGWACIELDPPEDVRVYDYRWPYGSAELMYCVFNYNAVTGLNLYYNALPAGADTACLIGRIEALREYPFELSNPTIETDNQTMTFPVSMQPDEYMELDWHGAGRLFEPDGGLISEVKPVGSLNLLSGDNRIHFQCEADGNHTPRAEVTLAVRGAPMADVKNTKPVLYSSPTEVEAGSLANRYSTLSSVPGPVCSEIRRLPDGKGGYRIMQGVYERVFRGVNLPETWRFKKDPEDRGLTERWFAGPVDAAWSPVLITRAWTEQGHDYHGVAWYAVTIEIPVDYQGTSPVIQFGAVDGFADIFLDGVKIGEQKQSPDIMWDQPFQVSLPADLDFRVAHDLVVRVKKDSCQAGIWKMVTIRPQKL